MQCPVCGNYEHETIAMESGQFSERLVECLTCKSSWSINHGHAEVVIDTQLSSFLQGQSECVEADDYSWAN
ncbi:MAG: hypothetical protein QM483_02095 [Desulfuromusa sp.]